jgi:hypothetical protein
MTQAPLALLGDLRRQAEHNHSETDQNTRSEQALLLLPAIVATLFLPAEETFQEAEDVKGIPTAFIPLRLLH